MDPARFEHLEELARKLGKALKKALKEFENNITTDRISLNCSIREYNSKVILKAIANNLGSQ